MREENLIILPAGKLSVEEACSGLRYLLAALTLGCLYAYLNYETLRARIVVVLVSAGAAVLANILRVFIVVYLGYSTDMQHPYVHDHLMLGWYLFGGVVVLLLMVDTLIQRHLRREHGQQERAEAVRAHGGPDAVTSGQAPSKYALSAFLGILLLSVGPAVAHSINNLPERNIIRMDIELSETLGDWESAADFKDDWKPLYHGASEIKQAFHRSDDRIVLYAGCYGTQTQGKELINDLNRINNEDVWRAVYPRGRIVRQGDDWALEQILEAKDGRQRLVWYWYRLSGKDVVNKYLAKIFQLSSLITTKPQACVIAAATDVGQDFETARERLAEFLLEAGPAVVLMYDEL